MQCVQHRPRQAALTLCFGIVSPNHRSYSPRGIHKGDVRIKPHFTLRSHIGLVSFGYACGEAPSMCYRLEVARRFQAEQELAGGFQMNEPPLGVLGDDVDVLEQPVDRIGGENGVGAA